MDKVLKAALWAGLAVLSSCERHQSIEDTGFPYIIEGSVTNGDSTFISLYIPGLGLDNRQTVQILDGKYRFEGFVHNYEPAFIRFENDIVNPVGVFCNISVIIEKDTVVLNFHVDSTDFGLCFKDWAFQKGSNNLFCFQNRDGLLKDPIWVFSDPVKRDSMNKYVYPGIKKQILDNYQKLFLHCPYPVVSLYFLNNIVENLRDVFAEKYLTESEKEKIQLFLSNIDPSLQNTLLYNHLKNSIDNLVDNKGFSFKDFTLINDHADSIRVSEIISRNDSTVIYFWWSMCAPCRKLIHDIAPKYSQIKGKGIEIVSVNTDESKKLWQEISRKDSITWINLYAGDLSEIAAYYNIRQYPTIFILDRYGNLLSDQYEDFLQCIEE